jgi:hypothetical protein
MIHPLSDYLLQLGFRHAWSVDFEFAALPGHKPVPVCMVAKCAITGEVINLWGDELNHCPFTCDDSELFIAYYASAESSCFDVLGWPRPRRVLDLYVEFLRSINGVGAAHGKGLIGALLHFNLPTIGGEEKVAMRELAMRGGPWTDAERASLRAYCETDVDAVLRLLESLLDAIGHDCSDFGRALLRGRYMASAGVVENNGIPIDIDLYQRLILNWPTIVKHLIDAVDADFGIYDDGRFVEARFEAYLVHKNIHWPRLASGRLALDDETFRQQARKYIVVAPLHELRHTLGQLRLNNIAVGPDGRNRTMLSAFRSKTSRNQPSNSKFIFGPAVWIRHLIKPTAGRAVAYVDWSSQEIAIAAALSGDPLLWAAYDSGDPYLSFAKQAGIVPVDATKETHPDARQQCKAIVLGVNYGMMPASMAAQSGIHIDRARELLRLHKATYRTFWTWAENNVDHALMGLPLSTAFGWRIHYPHGRGLELNSRSLLNWPMQSHGAEMMRLAVSMSIEEGLMICAPVHDALLLEAPIDQIDNQVARLSEIMAEASEFVLGPTKRCRTDAKIVRYPDRFEDEKRGAKMFSLVVELLQKAEAPD